MPFRDYAVNGSVLWERKDDGSYWAKCCGCWAIAEFRNLPEVDVSGRDQLDAWVESHKDHVISNPLPDTP